MARAGARQSHSRAPPGKTFASLNGGWPSTSMWPHERCKIRGDSISAWFMSPPGKSLALSGVERQARATSHRLASQVDWRIAGNQRRRGVNPEACAADVRSGSFVGAKMSWLRLARYNLQSPKKPGTQYILRSCQRSQSARITMPKHSKTGKAKVALLRQTTARQRGNVPAS